jgi:hypothetical protein
VDGSKVAHVLATYVQAFSGESLLDSGGIKKGAGLKVAPKAAVPKQVELSVFRG